MSKESTWDGFISLSVAGLLGDRLGIGDADESAPVLMAEDVAGQARIYCETSLAWGSVECFCRILKGRRIFLLGAVLLR